MPDGKVGIRIVKFGFVRHLFSLLAQQVSGVQADVRIVNQNAVLFRSLQYMVGVCTSRF
ncbi:hypothetical protein BFD40_25475 [Escherichia coli]|nr:hypothetical protein BFD40_25475 [Escherichia coli]